LKTIIGQRNFEQLGSIDGTEEASRRYDYDEENVQHATIEVAKAAVALEMVRFVQQG
jgi:hypothetical protein